MPIELKNTIDNINNFFGCFNHDMVLSSLNNVVSHEFFSSPSKETNLIHEVCKVYKKNQENALKLPDIEMLQGDGVELQNKIDKQIKNLQGVFDEMLNLIMEYENRYKITYIKEEDWRFFDFLFNKILGAVAEGKGVPEFATLYVEFNLDNEIKLYIKQHNTNPNYIELKNIIEGFTKLFGDDKSLQRKCYTIIEDILNRYHIKYPTDEEPVLKKSLF